MAKRTIEIDDDDLQELIDDCFEALVDMAREYLKYNPDSTK